MQSRGSTNLWTALLYGVLALGLTAGCSGMPRRRFQSPASTIPPAPPRAQADPSTPKVDRAARAAAAAAAVGDDEDDDEPDTDLDRPRAERRGGGGGPTRAMEKEDEEKEEEDEEDEVDGYCKPDLLNRALGLDNGPIRLFGWLQGSFSANPRLFNDGQNFGVNPNNLANAWTFQQLYLVVEKRAEQADCYDWGFRADNLFGNDWQNFHNAGFLNHAFEVDRFGWNPVQLYGEVHLPWLTEGGVEIKGGRFYALPGYEDGMAPARPLLSTGYLFSYAHPFTHFGMMTTWHVTDRLNVSNGAVNGWDRWLDTRTPWGYAGAISWDSPDDRTNVTLTTNLGQDQISRDPATEDGPPPPPPPSANQAAAARPFIKGQRPLGYGGKTTALFTQIIIHEWTERFSTIAEADEAFENASLPPLGAGRRPINASWYGVSGWGLYEFTDQWTGVVRGEVFRDQDGVRTGFADTFSEGTLGLIYKPKPWFWVRPEARYDRAQRTHPYDNGRHGDQFTFGFDVLVLF